MWNVWNIVAVIQYGHLVGHVTRHLPPLYYWLSATLSFLSRISNSILLLPNGQKTALFCVPQLLLLNASISGFTFAGCLVQWFCTTAQKCESFLQDAPKESISKLWLWPVAMVLRPYYMARRSGLRHRNHSAGGDVPL